MPDNRNRIVKIIVQFKAPYGKVIPFIKNIELNTFTITELVDYLDRSGITVK